MSQESLALTKIDANFEIAKAYLFLFNAMALTKKKLEIVGMSREEIDEFINDSKIRAKNCYLITKWGKKL